MHQAFYSKRLFLNLERVLYIRETPSITQDDKPMFVVFFDTGASTRLTAVEAESVLKAIGERARLEKPKDGGN